MPCNSQWNKNIEPAALEKLVNIDNITSNETFLHFALKQEVHVNVLNACIDTILFEPSNDVDTFNPNNRKYMNKPPSSTQGKKYCTCTHP